MVQTFKTIVDNWNPVARFLKLPSTEEELDLLIEFSHFLMDKIDKEEDKALDSLLDIVGNLINEYEMNNISEPEGTPIDVLNFLMEEHGLQWNDLTELGDSYFISEIVSGKKELSKQQIMLLSERFDCSPALFF